MTVVKMGLTVELCSYNSVGLTTK